MKRLFPLFLALIFIGQSAHAQTFQLNPYVGYTTSSKLETGGGKYRTRGNMNFGGNLSFGRGVSGAGFSRNAFVELQYNYCNTDLEFRGFNGGKFPLGEISVHNIMIGGTKGAGNGKVEGYGGTFLGVTIYDQSAPSSDTYTRFTVAFGGGMKYFITPSVGLRLHAQMYLPVWGGDLLLSWSPGGGVQPGAVATAMSVFGNFDAGIFFNLESGK